MKFKSLLFCSVLAVLVSTAGVAAKGGFRPYTRGLRGVNQTDANEQQSYRTEKDRSRFGGEDFI